MAVRRHRALILLVALAGIAVLGGLGWCGVQLGSKARDPGWEACGLTQNVRDVVATDDGRVVAAVTWVGGAEIHASEDACGSFSPWGVETGVIWSVDWLPQRGAVCAGVRGGLRCDDPVLDIREGVDSDVYFAREAGDTVVIGGATMTRYFEDGAWREAQAPLGVHHDALALGERVLLSTHGQDLSESVDGGRTFDSTDMPGASVLAGRGDRVYAAGGVFGGFLRRSDDGGKTWREVSMPGSQPEVLLLPTDDLDFVVLGTHGDLRPGAAFLSRDGGEHWEDLGCPGAEIHALAADDTYLYCGGKTAPMPKAGDAGLWRRPLADLRDGQ